MLNSQNRVNLLCKRIAQLLTGVHSFGRWQVVSIQPWGGSKGQRATQKGPWPLGELAFGRHLSSTDHEHPVWGGSVSNFQTLKERKPTKTGLWRVRFSTGRRGGRGEGGLNKVPQGVKEQPPRPLEGAEDQGSPGCKGSSFPWLMQQRSRPPSGPKQHASVLSQCGGQESKMSQQNHTPSGRL